MSQKVVLVYEGNEYKVQLNGVDICTEKDMDKAYEAFKVTIKNNTSNQDVDWETIKNEMLNSGVTSVNINDEYKNISLGNIKYFYHSDKAFYTGEGTMTALIGGRQFLGRVVELVAKGLLTDYNALGALCIKVIEEKANYSLAEGYLTITSAAFSYGKVVYDFERGKMDKGTTSEKTSFEVFSEYVSQML